MDRHRIRLSTGTSSQDVPVRAYASGGPNTMGGHVPATPFACPFLSGYIRFEKIL